jgi:hypothetical protein
MQRSPPATFFPANALVCEGVYQWKKMPAGGPHGSLRAYQIFVYFEEESGRRSAAKLLSKDEASRTTTVPETARQSCP